MSVIQNAAGNQTARVYPWGNLQVSVEGNAIFSDAFDGTVLDTTYRWNAPVTAGAGALAISGGLASFTVGTGASSAVALNSDEAFINVGASFLQYATIVQWEAGNAFTGLLPVNVNSFFGQGSPNGAYTAATPLNNAIGFERTIDGNISAVLYSSTVRIPIAVLTSRFLDGAPHVIGIATRGDTKYFFVDNLEVPVASITYVTPAIINLPIRAHVINHTSGPAVAPTFKITGVQVLDSGSSYPVAFNGNNITRARSPGIFINLNAVSIAAETTIWTPTAGKRFRLMGYVLTSGTVGGNVVLKDNTAGTTILVLPFGAAAQPVVSPPMGNGILSNVIGNVLTATGSATQTISGYLFGCEE